MSYHHPDGRNYDEVTQNVSENERLMALLIYVTSFFTALIAPLIIWLLNREESHFVDITGKNYLNFFISYFIWISISTALMIVLIGFITTPILAIMSFIFHIIGIIKAYNGEHYLPPLSIRFFR
ncbi:DUF4870 domain-containing protein [Staphylococcus canis]|uniref:DUF4870 domain-containing protein n=1 Tax=Staphylococcus canis TaxID=2724942 RepID=A0ABS0T9G0_9STAP|nr:DUF4870 domain-containing protein [Staphylococcus canis]MBI5974601.1 DUF4870 domain-containing protein [Staphylococcus canis]